MTALELQQRIVDALNGCEELVQGGCRAFAEDSRTVYQEASAWTSCGKVALVVMTPEFERDGVSLDGVPVEAKIEVQCTELPKLARAQAGVMTALDAAEAAMHCLGGDELEWLSTRQTFDPRAGALTATATFSAVALLTPSDSGQPLTADS